MNMQNKISNIICKRWLAAIAVLFMMSSCKPVYNRMRIINYKMPDEPETVIQDFREAYFYQGKGDDYYIVLKSQEPMNRENKRILQQILYAKLLWKPIPGRTYAESSQINAKIEYLITVVDSSDKKVIRQDSYIKLRYLGTGFICFSLNRKADIMTGTIEQALLEPVEKSDKYPLGRFILSGKFRAVRNSCAVAECRMILRATRMSE